MFLDTIYNYRSTEPVWFRFVRGFFAIILMGSIIYYSNIQFQKINKEVTVIFKDIESDPDKMDYGLNIKMCTGISNEMNIVSRKENFTSTQINNLTSYYQIVNLNYSSLYYYIPIFSTYSHNTQPLLNITTTLNKLNNYTNRNITYNFDFDFYNISPLNIPNNLLFLSIESFHFIGNIDLPVITFDNERFVNDSENLISLNYKFGRIEPAHFSLYLGQAYFISFNPIIVNDNKLYKLELNPQLEQLPIQLAPNETHIHIYPRSNPRVEIRRMYNFTDLLSNLGGFYGATAGIFYLLFGMQKHEPWGLVQKYLLSCMPCRKSLKKNFARKYVSSAGIPLAEKVNKRPEGSSLEERVQILETLLRDYYLDDYYLQKVKDVKFKHKKFTREYEMIRQENENTELNT